MSKVQVTFPGIKETYEVAAATVTTGWKTGQLFGLDASRKAVFSADYGADKALCVAIDPSTDLSTPPTGSLITGLHGSATLYITHAVEVAKSDSTRVYESDVESGAVGDLLYASANLLWTTSSTGSAKGSLIEVPSAANSYRLGIMLRM